MQKQAYKRKKGTFFLVNFFRIKQIQQPGRIIFVLLISVGLWAQEKPHGKRAWEHTNILASDQFKGRKSGTPEYLKAAEYVAKKMTEYGLQPGGDDGTYFQPVKFKGWQHVEPPMRLEITTPKQITFAPGRSRDFLPNRGTGSGIVKGQLVFAGYGLQTKTYEWDDYAGLNIEGKIVLLVPGAPEFMEKLPKIKKTTNDKIKTAVEKGAAGVLFMNIGDGLKGRRYLEGARKGTCPEGFVVLTANERALDEIFYSAGLSWRTLISQTLRKKHSITTSLDATVEMEVHFIEEDREAPNILGIIPGRHPELKEEYILVGGHLDHLGVGMDGVIYNGADDNAASVAVILELARVFQAYKFRPARSIVFAAWAGEELGLIGSKLYTQHPIYPLEKTVVYMNMDMVGCGDDDLYAGGMWEFADFYDILKQNMSDTFKEKLRYRLDYRGSDHTSFLNKGVTSISLRTGNPLTRGLEDEHPEYHRPGDDPSLIQPELLELAAEYYRELIEFLANTEQNLLDPIHHINFLHKNSMLVDMHCDTISRHLRGVDLTQDNDRGHIDIPKLKQGAVDLQVFACYVGPPRDEAQKNQAAKRAFDQIDAVHELVENNPEDLLLVTEYEDLRKLRGTRKTGVLIGIEGGYAIENDIRLLRSFYRSGVRLMTLTHWLDTSWADASGDPDPQLGGLTELGEQVVREMNKLSMIIDLSHAHDETFWDVLAITEDPVIASHSCCRALSEHHRNLSDEMLEALAKNGGVIGINYSPGFLDADSANKLDALRSELLEKYGLPEDRREFAQADPEAREKFRTEYRVRSEELQKTLPRVDVKTVVDHIEHVIKVTGNANHVGLGSDFDGIGRTPEGLEHAGKLAGITAELVRRGHKDSDIQKILGGNFLRVFQKVRREDKNQNGKVDAER